MKEKQMTIPPHDINEIFSSLEKALSYYDRDTPKQLVYEISNIKQSVTSFLKEYSGPLALGIAVVIISSAMKQVRSNS